MLYGITGLLFLPMFAVTSAMATPLPAQPRVGMMVFGVGFALFAPTLYAALGFVFGSLGALVYNAVAKWIGGIEVEVE